MNHCNMSIENSMNIFNSFIVCLESSLKMGCKISPSTTSTVCFWIPPTLFKMFGRRTASAPIDSDVNHSGVFLSKCDPQKFKSFWCHPRKVVFVWRLPTDLLFQVTTSPTEDVFVFFHRKAFCFRATRRKSELFQCTNRWGFPRKTTCRRVGKAWGCNIWSTAKIKEHKISRKWPQSTIDNL